MRCPPCIDAINGCAIFDSEQPIGFHARLFETQHPPPPAVFCDAVVVLINGGDTEVTMDVGQALDRQAAVSGLDDLIPATATLTKLATGATWSEGPVWMPESATVRWSDIPGNRIMQYSTVDGSTSVYAADAEFTNGRTLDTDGTVIQCSHGRRRVERDDHGAVTSLVDSYNGVRLNSPNDVIVAPDGSVWFTDPPYGITIPVEGHPGEREYGDCYVFRFDPASGSLWPVVTDMFHPNGLAFSPDGSILYVSDTAAEVGSYNGKHIRAYDVVDGRCKNGRAFVNVPHGVSDGFRIDVDGNLWTSAGDGVHVFDHAGTWLGSIAVEETVANVCFGGPDGRHLFIAASTSLYGIQTLTTDAASHGPDKARPDKQDADKKEGK
jgi:gluconolactonase